MKKLIIKAGKHRPYNRSWLSFYLFNFFNIKGKLENEYLFHDSCKQILTKDGKVDEDQWDWSKLMGISYGLSPLSNSQMIGFRYNPNIDKMEFAIYRNDSILGRYYEKFFESDTNIRIKFRMENTENGFKCSAYIDNSNFAFITTKVSFFSKRKIGYLVGIYYGGNKTPNYNLEVDKFNKPYI